MTKARDLANFVSGTNSLIDNSQLENSSITIRVFSNLVLKKFLIA